MQQVETWTGQTSHGLQAVLNQHIKAGRDIISVIPTKYLDLNYGASSESKITEAIIVYTPQPNKEV